MKEEIIITNPIGQDGHERTDIDYYIKNGEWIATVIRPLYHLMFNGYRIEVVDISKDYILKIINSVPNMNLTIGSSYPTDNQILQMVENFTKDLDVSRATKRATAFGYQEGLYKMVELWKQSNIFNK